MQKPIRLIFHSLISLSIGFSPLAYSLPMATPMNQSIHNVTSMEPDKDIIGLKESFDINNRKHLVLLENRISQIYKENPVFKTLSEPIVFENSGFLLEYIFYGVSMGYRASEYYAKKSIDSFLRSKAYARISFYKELAKANMSKESVKEDKEKNSSLADKLRLRLFGESMSPPSWEEINSQKKALNSYDIKAESFRVDLDKKNKKLIVATDLLLHSRTDQRILLELDTSELEKRAEDLKLQFKTNNPVELNKAVLKFNEEIHKLSANTESALWGEFENLDFTDKNSLVSKYIHSSIILIFAETLFIASGVFHPATPFIMLALLVGYTTSQGVAKTFRENRSKMIKKNLTELGYLLAGVKNKNQQDKLWKLSQVAILDKYGFGEDGTDADLKKAIKESRDWFKVFKNTWNKLRCNSLKWLK